LAVLARDLAAFREALREALLEAERDFLLAERERERGERGERGGIYIYIK
jgi:hypothetical protein